VERRSDCWVVLTAQNVTAYFFFEPVRWRFDFAVSFAQPSSSKISRQN